jgi:hypothetical protein
MFVEALESKILNQLNSLMLADKFMETIKDVEELYVSTGSGFTDLVETYLTETLQYCAMMELAGKSPKKEIVELLNSEKMDKIVERSKECGNKKLGQMENFMDIKPTSDDVSMGRVSDLIDKFAEDMKDRGIGS